jgi:hypothetical protein
MMLDYTRFNSLFESHHYSEAVAEARRLRAASDTEGIGPLVCLAKASLAIGNYAEALLSYGRVDSVERRDPRISGPSGRRILISCIDWMLGNKSEAIRRMKEMVDGILDGTIEFGDAAGGVQQGSLLYYMSLTMDDRDIVSKALSYLQNRAKRRAIKSFPGHVARYYLEEIRFSDVIAASNKSHVGDLAQAIEIAQTDLLSRRRLCVALFHGGAKARALGDELQCKSRMQECFSLENPLIEPEWYLARHEVQSQQER